MWDVQHTMTLPVCLALHGTHAGEKDMEAMVGTRKMDTLFGARTIERRGLDAPRRQRVDASWDEVRVALASKE